MNICGKSAKRAAMHNVLTDANLSRRQKTIFSKGNNKDLTGIEELELDGNKITDSVLLHYR